jgi:hypothetical protein
MHGQLCHARQGSPRCARLQPFPPAAFPFARSTALSGLGGDWACPQVPCAESATRPGHIRPTGAQRAVLS